MNIMLRTSKIITISLMPDFLREIEKVAKEEKRTKSELVREALRRYMAAREWDRLSRYARKRAAKAGIETEEDIQWIVDEFRREKTK